MFQIEHFLFRLVLTLQNENYTKNDMLNWLKHIIFYVLFCSKAVAKSLSGKVQTLVILKLAKKNWIYAYTRFAVHIYIRRITSVLELKRVSSKSPSIFIFFHFYFLNVTHHLICVDAYATSSPLPLFLKHSNAHGVCLKCR